jgi:hypothetical protein
MNVSAHQRIPSFLPLRAELPLFAYLVTESLVSNQFPAVQLSCECLLSVHLVLSDWFVVFRLSTEASSDHNLTAAFFPFSCSEELVNLLHTVVIRFLPVPKDRISADHFPINSFSRFQAVSDLPLLLQATLFRFPCPFGLAFGFHISTGAGSDHNLVAALFPFSCPEGRVDLLLP